MTTGFIDGGGIVDASPFGAFTYSLNLDSTYKNNPTNVKTLAFTVSGPSNLSIANIGTTAYGTKQLAFAADVFSNGNTGNVAALAAHITQGVPEPASWALMIIGFGGVGAALRHRRRHAILVT